MAARWLPQSRRTQATSSSMMSHDQTLAVTPALSHVSNHALQIHQDDDQAVPHRIPKSVFPPAFCQFPDHDIMIWPDESGKMRRASVPMEEFSGITYICYPQAASEGGWLGL